MEITENSTLEETLQAFIADEYWASMQYKMSKVAAKGKALNYANKIFDDNGDEENEHFDELVKYAQSVHIPVQLNPNQLSQNCTTPFADITDGDSTAQLVSILISAENKAIAGYETALRNTAIISEHPELTQFFGELLNDERGHLKELEDVMSNIENDNGNQLENIDVNGSSPTETENQEAFGESVESRNYTLKMLELLDNGVIDEESLAKNLLNYLSEDDVAKFADSNEYFDSEMANETSQYDARQCTNKFIEMIEDGMIDSKKLSAELMDFMSEDEVSAFALDLGYVEDEPKNESVTESIELSNCGFSFHDIFTSTVVK